jgi:hypothetical protein
MRVPQPKGDAGWSIVHERIIAGPEHGRRSALGVLDDAGIK